MTTPAPRRARRTPGRAASSALRIAVPPAGSASTSSALASSIASREPARSRWTGATAVTTPDRRPAEGGQRRRSRPPTYIPISRTAARCSGPRRRSVSGSPISLFWLPSLLSVGIAAARTAAVASLVDVLATLPVMPTTSGAKRARQAAADGLEAGQAVGDADRRSRRRGASRAASSSGRSVTSERRGPGRRGGAEVAVAVGPLAGQGHEEAAGRHQPGVDGASPDGPLRAAEQRAPRRRDELVGGQGGGGRRLGVVPRGPARSSRPGVSHRPGSRGRGARRGRPAGARRAPGRGSSSHRWRSAGRARTTRPASRSARPAGSSACPPRCGRPRRPRGSVAPDEPDEGEVEDVRLPALLLAVPDLGGAGLAADDVARDERPVPVEGHRHRDPAHDLDELAPRAPSVRTRPRSPATTASSPTRCTTCGRRQDPPVDHRAVGGRQLEERHGHALPERAVGDVDLAPRRLRRVAHDAGHLAGQVDPGLRRRTRASPTCRGAPSAAAWASSPSLQRRPWTSRRCATRPPRPGTSGAPSSPCRRS